MQSIKQLIVESTVKDIEVFNETDIKVDLSDVILKVKDYLDMVKKSDLPLKVKIMKKSGKDDFSNYNMETRVITLMFTKRMKQKEMNWVFAHEFAHFLQHHNKELTKSGSFKEQEILHKFITNKMDMEDDETYIALHDLYPMEVFANTFATLINGFSKKIHPVKDVEKVFRKKIKK